MSLELARITAIESVPARLGHSGGALQAPHAERVTVSDGGRSGSDASPSVPQGTVRWYRASALPARRSGVAPELLTDADASSAAAAPQDARIRTTPGALAAYRATMAMRPDAASTAAFA